MDRERLRRLHVKHGIQSNHVACDMYDLIDAILADEPTETHMSEYSRGWADGRACGIHEPRRPQAEIHEPYDDGTPGEGYDGWIDWHGGECPVDGEMDVEFELRGGHSPANMVYWEHREDASEIDIIRYRVVEPKPNRMTREAMHEDLDGATRYDSAEAMAEDIDRDTPDDVVEALRKIETRGKTQPFVHEHAVILAAAVRKLAWYIDSPRGGINARVENAEATARAIQAMDE